MPGALEEGGNDVLLRNMHIIGPAARPKKDERCEHETCRESKGKGETSFLAETGHSSQKRDCYGGDHAANVDGGVEHGEVSGEGLDLLRQLELVSSQGDHTRLDPPSANCYQEDANERDLKNSINSKKLNHLKIAVK